jgi:hypothetical protein
MQILTSTQNQRLKFLLLTQIIDTVRYPLYFLSKRKYHTRNNRGLMVSINRSSFYSNLDGCKKVCSHAAGSHIQGGALNRGLFFADPLPSLLGAVSGKISEIR